MWFAAVWSATWVAAGHVQHNPLEEERAKADKEELDCIDNMIAAETGKSRH